MSRCRFASVATATTVAAFATLAQAQVVVTGDATCPSADMIRAALASARPDGEWAGQKVTVEVAQGRLFLTMGEAPAVRRELPADPDCSVRAESVAVVIAAWSGALSSGPADSIVSSAPAAPPVLPRPAETIASTPPVEAAVPSVTSAAPAPAPVKPRSHAVELDGAAFYSPLWGHAPGAWLGVGRTPREGGLGARLVGAYQAARDVALEGGTNQVLRLLFGAAVTYHYQRTYLFASGDLGFVGTYTRAQGVGYETNGTATTTNLGGIADLRGGVRIGRARLWLNARALRMLNDETVKVQSTSPGVADSAVLAAWDLQLGAGLGYRFD